MPHTSLEHRFTFTLANGLHARPASVLVEIVSRFKSSVSVTKICDGAPCPTVVDARSVLSLVGLDIKKGDEVILVVAGPDADATLAALREVIDHKLCETDELPPPPPAAETEGSSRGARALPIGLRRINVNHALGHAICSGIATGQAVHHSGLVLPPEVLAARPGKPDKESNAALTAMAEVQLDLDNRAREAPTQTERDLLAAHATIAADPALRDLVSQETKNGATSIVAIARATDKLAAQLRAAQSAYIRDRAIDVQDVGIQIITVLGRGQFIPCAPTLERDSVVFAETLTPNQLLKMDRRLLKGLVLGRVGATSHTIILARSMSLPTLINVDNPLAVARPGDQVLVDASSGAGFVLAHISLAAARYYDRERRTQSRRRARLAPLAATTVTTTDGQKLEVGANASTPEEAATGAQNGADGVGLLRTELLFLDRAQAPSEQEQYEAYSAVLRNTTRPSNASSTLAPSRTLPAVAGRSLALPVIIRTFDIGGDKPAPYIQVPREENPFLGVRGLRLYEAHPTLLKSQLRAILRAAAHGPIKLMAPMVATPTEAAWFRQQVQAAAAELKAEGIPHAHPQVGAMIEVPAAALAIDHLAPHCDFFSLGTNDLSQYFLAADRGNRHPSLTPLHNPRHPAFLRLLRQTVRAAKQANRWIGVCGEMAGDLTNLPLMLGLGLDEISVAPGAILSLKRAASQADAKACRDLLDQACNCQSPAEVEQLLATVPRRAAATASIIDAELIEVHSDALTKEEAIKDAVDLLHIAGRTEDPREVEEATWAREETYSTALGFGFAVPHCKSTTISAPSLAFLKLQRPIDWGSKDGDPVKLVFLLAVPAADTTGAHMKIFAKLARKLMHEEFRETLARAPDAATVERTLKSELDLA